MFISNYFYTNLADTHGSGDILYILIYWAIGIRNISEEFEYAAEFEFRLGFNILFHNHSNMNAVYEKFNV